MKYSSLILQLDDGTNHFFRCESSSCNHGELYYIYSWMHAFEKEKWIAIKATLDEEGKKASPYNPELKDTGGEYVELYCPECGKKILKKIHNIK